MLLLNCTSPETAHIVPDYPFGFHVRCMQRYWVEQATKGSHKGMFRMGTQTTGRKWNLVYTDLLKQDRKLAVNAQQSPTAPWNNPKYSIYWPFMLLYTDSEEHVQQFTMHQYGVVDQLLALSQLLDGAVLPRHYLQALADLLNSITRGITRGGSDTSNVGSLSEPLPIGIQKDYSLNRCHFFTVDDSLQPIDPQSPGREH